MGSWPPWIPGSSFLHAVRTRGLLLPVVLVIVTGAILVHGALDRGAANRGDRAAPAPTPEPTPSAFRAELGKIPLTYLSDYWLQLAEKAQRGLAGLGPAGATGVLLHPGYALSSIETADALAAAGGEGVLGRFVAADAREGVALFSLPPEAGAEPLTPAPALEPGAWVAAVTNDPEGGLQVTPGHLASTLPSSPGVLDVAIPFSRSLEVAAVVDLDSRLVGVALRLSHGVRVISVEAATGLVSRLARGSVCRALDVAPLPDDVKRLLKVDEGVVVETVWAEAFDPPSGLEPGDVLLNWGGRTTPSPEQFARAYDELTPGTSVRYGVVRAGRRITGRTEMPGRDCRATRSLPRPLPLLGAVGQWTRLEAGPGESAQEGLRLLSVPTRSPAARAGLEPADFILAVGGRRLAWPEARRLFETGAAQPPVILTVRRGDAVTLRALEPATE
jgi:S1-C subfamily serine protease